MVQSGRNSLLGFKQSNEEWKMDLWGDPLVEDGHWAMNSINLGSAFKDLQPS